MKVNKEYKFLTDLLKKIETDEKPIISRTWFNPIIWLFSAVVFLVLFQLFENNILGLFWVVMLATFLGMFLGFLACFQHGDKFWPYLIKHINTASIEARVNEITHNK